MPILTVAMLLPLAAACGSSDVSPDPSTTRSGGTYPGFPGAGGNLEPLPGAAMRCFEGEDSEGPIATIEHVLEVVEGVDAVHVRLTLDPNFVDNTFGEGSIGWGDKGHEFKKLVGSDHAQLRMFDRNDELAFDLRLDYISEDDSMASGYASLGVTDGDGKVDEGDPAMVIASSTSLDRNLNERGYASYTEDSPLTDESYTPNPAAPNWDYRVVYEVYVANEAFAAGFKTAEIEFIHASPSKSENTIIVDPTPCPPDWGCDDPDGCEEDPECNDPDGCDNDPNPPTDPECDEPEGCDPECNDPDGCDGDPNPPTDPECDGSGADCPPSDPECMNDDDCGPTEFCAEEGVCLPYVD